MSLLEFWRKWRRTSCVVCGRKLSSEKSKRLGMGLGCARKNPGLADARSLERAGQTKFPFPPEGEKKRLE